MSFKLLYIWIHDYNCLSNQGFNFDSKYIFKFDGKNNLDVEKNSIYIENFFSLSKKRNSEVSNITGVVGMNGSGKTTLIESLIDTFILKDFKDKLIIYSVEGKTYYDFNERELNVISEEIEIIPKEIDKIHIPSIMYIDQLYSTTQKNYDIRKYSGLVNISENYLLNNDGSRKKDNFIILQEKHYTEDLIRQLFYIIYLKDNNMNRLSFIPEYLKVKAKDYSLEIDKYFKDLEKNLNDRIKINSTNAGGYVDNDEVDNFSKEIITILKKLKDSYLEIINLVSKYDDLETKFIIKILVTIISENILEFNLPPITIGIFSDKYRIKNNLENLIKICKYILEKEKISKGIFIDILHKLQEYNDYISINNKYINNINHILDFFNDINLYYEKDSSDVVCLLPLNKVQPFLKGFKESILRIGVFSFHWSFKPKGDKADIRRLSSGENNYLSLFSRIYNSFLNKENIIKNDCLILIDECELAFHPEWQRKFIYNLIEFLESIGNRCKFHIIITSHSPFIVSDLPHSNILFLKKDEKTGLTVVKKEKPDSFAENIYSLFRNDFFMESLMGDFASEKLNRVISGLNSNEKINEEKLDEIRKTISYIGEPILKNKLLSMYNNRPEINVDKQITELENRLKELRSKQK